MSSLIQNVVIDCGSSMCNVGFAGDETPIAIFPSVVEYHKISSNSIMFGYKDKFGRVGDEVFCKIGTTWAKFPIERGTVVDWEGMEKVWYHIFHNELRTDPDLPNTTMAP